jgi:flagellar motility protein MotE (MotC chaperone)
VILAAALFAIAVGCQRITYESRLMKQKAAEGARYQKSAAEVKIYIDELVGVVPGTIEQAADHILAETTDAWIKKPALLWKINGIPTALRVMFHPDPAIAIVDTWAFCMQMSDYFDRGPGRADLGQYRYIALDASRRIEARIAHMIADGLPEGRIIQIREQLHTWVLKHPIERDFMHRDTTVPELAAIIGDRAMDTLQAIGSLAVGIEDLTEQLTTYLNLLPKQARWQADLLLMDMVDPSTLQQGLATAKALAESVNRVAPTVEHLPDSLAQERTALFNAVSQERTNTLAAVDAQRQATLDFLRRERETIIDELRSERLVITANLRSEREALLQAINAQRTATMNELEAAGRDVVHNASQRGEALLDHMAVRSLQVLAVLLVAVCIALVWLRRGSGNRRRNAD